MVNAIYINIAKQIETREKSVLFMYVQYSSDFDSCSHE